tara:strand:- start:272 stop:475 length:204 start_codon:yes stop_codon:yes gene_type:complete
MDPVQQLFMSIQSQKYKVQECQNQQKNLTDGAVIAAYKTIEAAHQATLNDLNAQLAVAIQKHLSSSK